MADRRALVDAIAKRRCNARIPNLWDLVTDRVRDQWRESAERVLNQSFAEPVIRDALVEAVAKALYGWTTQRSQDECAAKAERVVASVFGEREGDGNAG